MKVNNLLESIDDYDIITYFKRVNTDDSVVLI